MSKKLSNPIISVVITVHREGIIAHKTILSVLNALDFLEDSKEKYEIIVHIDNGDKETNDYFNRYKNDMRFKILRNSFGNPSDSRNFAIENAKGDYIAIIDGDDLITKNWFSDSLAMIKKHKKPIVLRPNFQLHFGGNDPHHNIWVLEDSFSKEEDALIMTFYNRWPNIFFTKKETLKGIRYHATSEGFGYEDWLFNCDLRAADIPNKVVPNTTFFYRRRNNSVTSQHVGTVLPYSNLFNFDFFRSINAKVPERKSPTAIQRIAPKVKSLGIKTIKQVPIVRKTIGHIAYETLYHQQRKKLPAPLIEGWKYLNSLDSQTWPTKDAISGVRFHPLSFDQHNIFYGALYKQLLSQVTEKPDYIFLVPQLSTGGTEKLLLNYISAISKAHPKWHIAVLSKLPDHHPYTFPKNVDFIDFDGITDGIDWYEKDVLWSRFLVQMGTKRLHVINHEGWYRWMASHTHLLENNGYIINASMFMREYESEPGRTRTFAEPYLTDIYPIINKIFTDNKTIAEDMIATSGFDKKKISVHYQPAPLSCRPPKKIEATLNRPLRVLWASRLSFQKRPDIIKKIAKKVDPERFHIDVYGREQHYTKEFFRDSQNITYKGPFNGIETIPIEKYDVYLYTSSVDGLPNILLEISALGLPIIASNDGGVSEFVIDKKTGFLCDIEDIDSYVSALEYLYANPASGNTFALESQRLLEKQHIVEKFEDNVKRDIY